MPKGNFIRSVEHRKHIAEATRKQWTPERRAKFSGNGNPSFGKKGMCGVAKLKKSLEEHGFTEEIYRQKISYGFRWCINHHDFLPIKEFDGRRHECKSCYADKRRAKRYDAPPGWYEAKLAEQGGHCALCPAYPEKRALDGDHNHVTGKLRGLLCSQCNVALERMETVQNWDQNAKAYLEKYA